MNKKDIAFIGPFVTHYRINFYNNLNRNVNNRIKFFFQEKSTNEGRPSLQINSQDKFYTKYKSLVINLVFFEIKISFDLIKKIIIQKPKIIIIEGSVSNLSSWCIILLKTLLKYKIIIWACGWESENKKKLIVRLKRIIERRFYNSAENIITYSSKAKLHLERRGIMSKINIAYNGIDLINDDKKQIIKNTNYDFPSTLDKNIYLYVGGIFPEKKVDLLIEAFYQFNKEFNNAILWIIGNGPSKNNLEMYIKENNYKNILFLGRIQDEADFYFNAAKYFILPGIGGLALNQAMLWETPCIVSEADGTEEDLVIDGKTGFRFKKDNINSLIKKLKQAHNLPNDKYEQMKYLCLDKIKTQSNTDKMIEVFSNVINRLP